MIRATWFVLLLLMAGCSSSGGSVVDSGAVDSGIADSGTVDSGVVDSGVADAGLPDAGVPDAGPPDSGIPDAGPPKPTSQCPRQTDAGCVPVGVADLKTLVMGGINMPAGFFHRPEHSDFLAVGPHYDTGTLMASRSFDGGAFELATGLPFTPSSDATGVNRSLYFVHRPSGAGSFGLYRSQLTDAGFAAATAVALNGSPIVPYWPQATALPDGRILLAFVESQQRAFLALSDATGTQFQVAPAPGTSPAPIRGVLAHVGVTAGGQWIFTHQEADPSFRFTSLYQLSSNGGGQWSTPKNVSPAFDNVHDLRPFQRLDVGADLYYLRVGGGNFFSTFRRMLKEDGSLGPEQEVTGVDVGHVEKPQAFRLPDGRVALMFARRIDPMRYDLCLVYLDGDAPP